MGYPLHGRCTGQLVAFVKRWAFPPVTRTIMHCSFPIIQKYQSIFRLVNQIHAGDSPISKKQGLCSSLPNSHMMTSSNGNIFRVTGPLCGEFTGPGEFPTQRPVTRSFDLFFDLRLNKPLSKQPWGWWFETLSRSLWRHRNAVDGVVGGGTAILGRGHRLRASTRDTHKSLPRGRTYEVPA